MIERAVQVGPGSLRVGAFVGRLGVVTMPAIQYGLELADRVVRRHVAKLETVGWCERTSAMRGDGSLVWMTAAGLDGLALTELSAFGVSDRFAPQTLHAVRVAWVAAELQRAGRRWHASRELAVEPDLWSVGVANERGGRSRQLPDLVFWRGPRHELPVAVVIARGASKPRREQATLNGWKESIRAGQYAQVRYLAPPAAARRVASLAEQIGLYETELFADEDLALDRPA